MAKRYFKNEEIRASHLLVVDETGKRLGEMSKEKALDKAREQGKDLVLIAWQARPPIAKIIEYGKFIYQQQKKEKKKQKKQKDLKEVRISFNISDHDLETKKRQVKKFLAKGHHVRLTMMLRGRENIFKKEASERLQDVAQSINAKIEMPVRIQGNVVQVQFSP